MSTVLLNVVDNIANITLNRPERMNTLNEQMADDLIHVTEEIMLDKSIRAVVLHGAGNAFSAGGDIQFFSNQLEQMPKNVVRMVRKVGAAIFNIRNMPKPVLACVHGAVAGVGFAFMLSADLVIASETTQFNLAYTRIGISPDGGVTYFLPRLVGEKKALELMMLSENFDAQTAKQYGIVNWIVEEKTLATETQHLAERLAKGPTASFAKTKALVKHSFDHTLPEQIEAEAESFAALSVTNDFKVGVNAFLAKKPTVFKGE